MWDIKKGDNDRVWWKGKRKKFGCVAVKREGGEKTGWTSTAGKKEKIALLYCRKEKVRIQKK